MRRWQRSSQRLEPVLLLFIIVSNTAIVAHWYFRQPEKIKFIGKDGVEIPVRQGVVNGHLDRMVLKDGSHVEFAGWAFDRGNYQLVDEILLHYDGEVIYRGETDRDRLDLVNVFGKAALKGGFRFVLPLTVFKDNKIDQSKVRLFAISNGLASELRYFKGFK